MTELDIGGEFGQTELSTGCVITKEVTHAITLIIPIFYINHNVF